MEIKIYLTNLGKYNEGELVGEWFTLPIQDIDDAFEQIGIKENTRYEEYFITDYICDLDLDLNKYGSLDELNSIAELLEGKDLDDLYYEISQEYMYEEYVYSMDEFDYVVDNKSPHEITLMVFNGDFNPNHDYFKFDGYGNLKSIDDYDYDDLKNSAVNEYIDAYIDDNI